MKLLVALSALALGVAFAQEPMAAPSSVQPDQGGLQPAVTDQQPNGPAGLNTERSRWLEINNLSFSMRYRSTPVDDGVHLFEYGQHRELLDGKFKFDRGGKYAVVFHGSSGRYFNWAYADAIGGQFTDKTGFATSLLPQQNFLALIHAITTDPDGLTYAVGIASRGAYFYLRQLYVSATPMKAVTFEFGSLAIEHGVNTEITSFDDDGYITGERMRIHDEKHLFFTEIDGTWAYLGDPFVPNFFERGNRLLENNYQQYLLKKKFAGRFVASADYNRLRESNTIREAIKMTTPELHWMDWARGEFYERTNNVTYYGTHMKKGSGFAASAGRRLNKRLDVEVGYASIDGFYAGYSGSPFLVAVGLSWNADTFVNGNRVYTKANLKVAPGLTFNGFFNHQTALHGAYSIDRQCLTAGFNMDFAELLHKRHIL